MSLTVSRLASKVTSKVFRRPQYEIINDYWPFDFWKDDQEVQLYTEHGYLTWILQYTSITEGYLRLSPELNLNVIKGVCPYIEMPLDQQLRYWIHLANDNGPNGRLTYYGWPILAVSKKKTKPKDDSNSHHVRLFIDPIDSEQQSILSEFGVLAKVTIEMRDPDKISSRRRIRRSSSRRAATTPEWQTLPIYFIMKSGLRNL